MCRVNNRGMHVTDMRSAANVQPGRWTDRNPIRPAGGGTSLALGDMPDANGAAYFGLVTDPDVSFAGGSMRKCMLVPKNIHVVNVFGNKI